MLADVQQMRPGMIGWAKWEPVNAGASAPCGPDPGAGQGGGRLELGHIWGFNLPIDQGSQSPLE